MTALLSRLLRSHRQSAASPPTASTDATASLPGPSLRVATSTRAPSAASRSTVARPMPWPPPVTMATRPLKRCVMSASPAADLPWLRWLPEALGRDRRSLGHCPHLRPHDIGLHHDGADPGAETAIAARDDPL